MNKNTEKLLKGAMLEEVGKLIKTYRRALEYCKGSYALTNEEWNVLNVRETDCACFEDMILDEEESASTVEHLELCIDHLEQCITQLQTIRY